MFMECLPCVRCCASFYDIESWIRAALGQNLLNGVPKSGSQMPMIAIKINSHVIMAQGHFKPFESSNDQIV